ncbi:hypothetical protein P608_18455 [Comamonas thiooxydans]|uniref:Uncharacterized protein n=1 Tax=Comamonas thiooxydans TaxID=363952 RepID=A0A0E3CEC8_9BURK|nr:hypothetical protein P608_18455 [Comamonas thiooxydans]KGH14368.1 hypothetical protein P607_22885 [Comamonas thiooxydans]
MSILKRFDHEYPAHLTLMMGSCLQSQLKLRDNLVGQVLSLQIIKVGQANWLQAETVLLMELPMIKAILLKIRLLINQAPQVLLNATWEHLIKLRI